MSVAELPCPQGRDWLVRGLHSRTSSSNGSSPAPPVSLPIYNVADAGRPPPKHHDSEYIALDGVRPCPGSTSATVLAARDPNSPPTSCRNLN